jgi:hypothetical protein
MAVLIIADSFAMTARSSPAVLQARTFRIKSLSFIDMILIHTVSLVTRRAERRSVFESAVATLAADSIERCGDDPNVYLRIVASPRVLVLLS